MLFQDKDEHSIPLFNSLKLFQFENNFNLKLAQFLWYAKNKNLPNCIQKLFNTSKNIDTRQDFLLPSPKTNIKKNSIFFSGVKFWNDKIPSNLKNLSKTSFTNRYKKYLANAQGFTL